jgi:hypothetical protein
MTLIFTTVSAAADYGNLGRWMLLISTVICWGSQFATMALTGASYMRHLTYLNAGSRRKMCPPVGSSRWPVAFVLYVINFTSFGITLVFYIAMFPRLARCTPRTLEMRDQLIKGQISKQEYDVEESMEKNRISNTANVSRLAFSVLTSDMSDLVRAYIDELHDWIRRHCVPQSGTAHIAQGQSFS